MVRLEVREKAFRVDFDSVRKLHTPSSTLQDYSVFVVCSEDDGMRWAGSVLEKHADKHLVLGFKEELGWGPWTTCFFPGSVSNPRVV